jgi:probable F420-dependent oxidoreductase
VALGYAAAVTHKITLLTYLTVLPYRNPLLLAKSAATVDLLSAGRFVLGVGTGYLKAEYFALGAQFDERNELFDEALDVMPLSWSGEPFSFEGRHFSARNVQVLPRPVQQPIPIWIGGNAPLTMRRVAARAQGWMPMLGSVQLSSTTRSPRIATVDELAQRISELRTMAGNRAQHIRVLVAYSDHSVHDVARETERHREAFATLESAGVDTLAIAGPSAPAPSAHDFIRAFGATFISD